MGSGVDATVDDAAAATPAVEPPDSPASPEPPPPASRAVTPPTPEPDPAPAEPAVTTPAEAPTASVVDIGGHVAVAATKPGLTRIGAAKCRICHKVQFASWEESPHASRTPPLDCEDCHGPGSEYKSKQVMEDPEQALAAGLVRPDLAFCAQCHTGAPAEDLLVRAHAHKVE